MGLVCSMNVSRVHTFCVCVQQHVDVNLCDRVYAFAYVCVFVRVCAFVRLYYREIEWFFLRACLQGAHDNQCQSTCAWTRASVAQHTCFLSVGTPEYMQNSEITCFNTHTQTQTKTFRHVLVSQKKTTHISSMTHTYKWMVPSSQLHHEQFSRTLTQTHTIKYNSHTHHHLSNMFTYVLLAHYPSL